MTNRSTHTRPGVINSRGVRKAFDRRSDNPLFGKLFNEVDSAVLAFDGLLAVKGAPNPTRTREANALEMKRQIEGTVSTVKRKLTAVYDEILSAAEKRIRAAEVWAGVDKDPAGGDEVRRALREMTEKQRQAALDRAVANGDRIVLASIANAPSEITVGTFRSPPSLAIDQWVRDNNPGLAEDIADYRGAMEHINMIVDSFDQGANKLRDRVAEEAAERGVRLATDAERQLRGTLGVDPTQVTQ